MSRKKPTAFASIPSELAPIVARMREAERKDAEADKSDAKKCGRDWAKDHATPRQLTRLFDRYGELDQATDDVVALTFVSIIADPAGDTPDWEDTRGFFAEHVGEGRGEDWGRREFVVAFADAALAVWEKVQAHVEAA